MQTYHILLTLAAASAKTLPKYAYRTIRVNSDGHRHVLEGQGLTAARPDAGCSVREHVLYGSGSKWLGSQYISVTTDLDIAARYAAPCHPILCIDVERFVSQFGGFVVDLSCEAAFERCVPPADGDKQQPGAAAKQIRRVAPLVHSDDAWQEAFAYPASTELANAQGLTEQAASTAWECACLFATRSKELLLVGTIPCACYRLLDTFVSTTRVDYLPGSSLPDFPQVKEFCAWDVVGGSNTGLIAFKLPGSSKRFHLRQARPNLGSSLLEFGCMEDNVDLEFAAFAFYRLVETHRPELDVHVRDCAKLSFNFAIENPAAESGFSTWPLKCIVFEHIEALRPVRVRWDIFPSWIPYLGPSSKVDLTTEQIVAHLRETAQPFSDADAAWASAFYGPGQKHKVCRQVESDFAIAALRGVAVDAFLANVYGWGVFDKPQLWHCPHSKKVFRMSAETALGSYLGTEHLNNDRQEPFCNLALASFAAANGHFRSFKPCQPGATVPDFGWNCSGSLTYFEATGTSSVLAVYKQLVALCSLILDHEDEVLKIFSDLPIPADALRIARMYSDEYECVDPKDFWKNFALRRPFDAMHRIGDALERPNEYARPLLKRVDVYSSQVILGMWFGFNRGVLLRNPIDGAAWVRSVIKPVVLTMVFICTMWALLMSAAS